MRKLKPGAPETQSADLVAVNTAKLRALFPEAFTEGKINLEALKAALGSVVDEGNEKYGLTWSGKRQSRQFALLPSTGTLRPCPEDSVDWANTKNIVLEGDNLEVLKLLQRRYSGQVKLIYIDPPYNTGNDLVYKDDFNDSIRQYLQATGQVSGDGQALSTNVDTSGRFHTDWLNMIYPRLLLARTLLSEDGTLFVSIDDNELPNLRKVCDEVFGPENFMGCISRVTGTPTGGGNKAIVSEIDYLLVYSRSSDTPIEGLPMSEDDASIYDQEDADGRYLIRSLRRTGGEDRREDRPTMYFPIKAPDGKDVYPRGPTGYESRWICGPAKYAQMKAGNLIEWRKVEKDGKPTWQVYQKFYLEGRHKQPSNLWSDIEGNKKATRDLKELFDGHKVFDSPKPLGLILKIIQMSAADPDSIILDFFAGSGTTGHAVTAMNAADGGSRRYLLVQLPELLDPEVRSQRVAAEFCTRHKRPANIAEITKERLRRAGRLIRKENPLFKGDTGFRVFRLDSSNIRAWEPVRDDLARTLTESVEHIRDGRGEQDILYEVLLKFGLDLAVPIETKSIAKKDVHSIGGGSLMVCLAPKVALKDVEPLANGMVAWRRDLNPAGETEVIFRDSAFADDVAKTNLTEILKQGGLSKVRSL